MLIELVFRPILCSSRRGSRPGVGEEGSVTDDNTREERESHVPWTEGREGCVKETSERSLWRVRPGGSERDLVPSAGQQIQQDKSSV